MLTQIKFNELRKLTYERRALINQLAKIVEDDFQNINYFSHDREYIIEEFEKKQEQYNDLLLELKCTHNNPIESNAKPFPIDMFESMGLKSPISELTDLTIIGEELAPTLERYLN